MNSEREFNDIVRAGVEEAMQNPPSPAMRRLAQASSRFFIDSMERQGRFIDMILPKIAPEGERMNEGQHMIIEPEVIIFESTPRDKPNVFGKLFEAAAGSTVEGEKVKCPPCPDCGRTEATLVVEDGEPQPEPYRPLKNISWVCECGRAMKLHGCYIESMETEYGDDVVKSEDIPLELHFDYPEEEEDGNRRQQGQADAWKAPGKAQQGAQGFPRGDRTPRLRTSHQTRGHGRGHRGA